MELVVLKKKSNEAVQLNISSDNNNMNPNNTAPTDPILVDSSNAQSNSHASSSVYPFLWTRMITMTKDPYYELAQLADSVVR